MRPISLGFSLFFIISLMLGRWPVHPLTGAGGGGGEVSWDPEGLLHQAQSREKCRICHEAGLGSRQQHAEELGPWD